jgi:hypothetical protein
MAAHLCGLAVSAPVPRGWHGERRMVAMFEDATERDYYAIAFDVRRGLAYVPPPRPRGRPKKEPPGA